MLKKISLVESNYLTGAHQYLLEDDLFGKINVEIENRHTSIIAGAIAATITTYQYKNLPIVENVLITLINLNLSESRDPLFDKILSIINGIDCAYKMLPENSFNKSSLFNEIYQAYLKLIFFE